MSEKVWDYLPEFAEALKAHLEADDKRWGDTWLKRTRDGQEGRVRVVYAGYFDKFEHAGQTIDWLAVAGNALICWIREQHPELFPK